VGAGNCGSIISEGNKVEKQNTLALNSGWIAALAVIERDVEFCCKLDGIERAAREKTVANLNGGNFSAAVVDAENQILCVWIVFNIDFTELQATSGHEGFGPAAIRAPRSGIHDDRSGWKSTHR